MLCHHYRGCFIEFMDSEILFCVFLIAWDPQTLKISHEIPITKPGYNSSLILCVLLNPLCHNKWSSSLEKELSEMTKNKKQEDRYSHISKKNSQPAQFPEAFFLTMAFWVALNLFPANAGIVIFKKMSFLKLNL